MMKRLEQITQSYWAVGVAKRHPAAPAITAERALKTLNVADKLRPEEWRLRELVHTLRYDIIEGNAKWRGNQKVVGSKLIQLIRP